MMLREAVSPLPDPKFARRLAVVFGGATALALGGAIVAFVWATPRTLAVPEHNATVAIAHKLERFAPAPTTQPTTEPAQAADVSRARLELATYSVQAFPKWVVSNPDRECPRHLLELNAFDPTLHAVDPWGTPYQFLCGKAQYGVNFTTRSAGPDRTFDSIDDLMSTQP